MKPWHNLIETESLSLDGEWEFSLAGQTGRIHTPGVWEAQGYPRRVDGPAIFRRRIHVPAEWGSRRIQLQFDAVSYHVEARVNGVLVGEHAGLWSAFAFDVKAAIRLGQDNLIELTVYKPGERFPMRESLAGFLPDVCIPFGGIWQSARLMAFPYTAFSEVWLLPDAATGRVRIEATCHSLSSCDAAIRLIDPTGNRVAQWRGPLESERLQAELTVPAPRLWSPADPARYTAELRLESEGMAQAAVRRTFGFRTLSHQGDQLCFNGDPVSLRGVLNWGWYPQILCPAPEEAAIRDEFRRVRALGYNLVKLCLYVPSPLYFEIADEEGLFLWLELPMWLPEVTPRLRQQAPLEYADILAQVHHHPSVVIYSLGCELGEDADADFLGLLNGILRSRTSGILACDNSGSGEAYGGLAFDYADFNDYHFYCDLHYFTPLVDHFSRDWRPPRPWIFGEFCDSDDFRDTHEIATHYGGSLPWWLTEKNPIHPLEKLAYSEQVQRMAQLVDLGFTGQDLQRISRQQSFAIRKAILEKVRGRAGMGGYVVTSIRDTPLATSSMFDDLGRAKVDAEAFRAFNAESVLLLEQGRARIWKRGGDRPAPVDRFNLTAGRPVDYRIVLSHTGQPLPGGSLDWQLADSSGAVQASGSSAVAGPLPGGTLREIASLAFTAPTLGGTYTLSVQFGAIRNQWPLWVYLAVTSWPDALVCYDPGGALEGLIDLKQAVTELPSDADLAALKDGVLVTSAPTEAVLGFIRRGGRALILQTGTGILPAVPRPFWRESVKLIVDHPVWNDFPHQGYTGMQFYHLATDHALDTDRLAEAVPGLSAVTPILRRLDARLFTLTDYLLELRIGQGIALASTLRFAGGIGDQVGDLKTNVAARHLLANLLRYLGG